jgi:hypothetical protein
MYVQVIYGGSAMVARPGLIRAVLADALGVCAVIALSVSPYIVKALVQ